jgi:hypothetical protein
LDKIQYLFISSIAKWLPLSQHQALNMKQQRRCRSAQTYLLFFTVILFKIFNMLAQKIKKKKQAS